MLKITIPDNNVPEREYIVNTLVRDLLGIEFELVTDNSVSDYSILLDDREILVRDCFFGRYPVPLSYLKKDAIPEKVLFTKNDFTVEKDIPVIYGTDEMLVTSERIICGIDIFASSFSMLTRWEESADKSRDEHNRFPGKESLALKNGFLNRAVVNEYLELLWLMLRKLGYDGERKKRSYELVFTHDVDILDYPTTARAIAADILKRKSLKSAVGHLKNYLSTGLGPYDFFDFLMTISETAGAKSHFYFMSSDSGLERDPKLYLHDRRFKTKISDIKSRGHIIGFHPGYYTYDNPDRWQVEKIRLEDAIQGRITEGRQHYLRFDIEKTFRIWDQNSMEIDSTMSYAQNEGFRCGTSDAFNVFDFRERRKLKLSERPLVVMDGTLHQYQKYSHEHALSVIQYYISVGRKYRAPITILFHNSSFYGEWEGYSTIYRAILQL